MTKKSVKIKSKEFNLCYPVTPNDFIEELQKLTEGFSAGATLYYRVSGYDGDEVDFWVEELRLETNEEYEKRLKAENTSAWHAEREERKLYEKLKKKFEGEDK